MRTIATILVFVALGFILTGMYQLVMLAEWTPERLIIFGVGAMVVAVRIYRGALSKEVADSGKNG